MIDTNYLHKFLDKVINSIEKEFNRIPFQVQTKLPMYNGFYKLAFNNTVVIIYDFELSKNEDYYCRLDRNKEQINFSCTCREPFPCIHYYLCIYDLMNRYKNPSKKEKTNISIKGDKSSEWRSLELKEFNSSSFRRFLNHDSYLGLSNYDLFVKDDNQLNFVGSTYYRRDDIDIELKKVDSALSFYCNTCSIVTNKFCEHQSLVFEIDEIRDSIYTYFTSKMNLDGYYKMLEKNLKVPKSTLINNYNPVIYNNEFALKPMNDSLFSNFDDFLIQYDLVNNDNEKNRSKYFKKLSISKKLIYACCWKIEEGYSEFIQGVPKKNSIELSTHLKSAENIDLSNNEIVSFLKPVFDEYSNLDSQAIIRLLNLNISSLNEIQHYFDKRDYSGFEIKRKFLNLFEFSKHTVVHQVNKVESDEGLLKYQVEFLINGKKLTKSTYTHFPYFLLRNGIAFIFSSEDTKRFFYNSDKNPIEFSFLEHKLKEEFHTLPQQFQALLSTEEVFDTENLIKQVHISKESDFILFEPSLIVNNVLIELLNGSIQNENVNEVVLNELRYFRNLHIEFAFSFIDQTFYLHKDSVLVDNWFFSFMLSLQQNGYKIFGQDIISKLKINANRSVININILSQANWFEPQIDIKFGEISVAQESWLKAIKRNDQYIELSDGSVGLISTEWYGRLKEIYNNSIVDKKTLKISKLKFNSIDKLFPLILEDTLREELEERKNAFKEFSSNQVYPLPKALDCTLREYQYEGYQWLMFLDNFGFGGVLADDMGLGKTVQMIVFLQMQKEYNNGSNLVIVPKSILGNWIQELEKFASDLNYLNYTGSDRHSVYDEILSFDIVLSTYDTISRDIDKMLKYSFNYVVLDESQNIKNPTSKRYKALKLMRSRNKLAMTGTPIENNTFDLYAQFSFVNPGFFGSIAQFRTKFSDKIDVHRDKETAELLRKMIFPFLMRRTKEQVANDLPEKNEIVLYCELPEAQRQMYETIRLGVLKDLSKTKSNIKFKALEGMLKLRKLCNSPILVDKSLKGESAYSIKIDTLLNKLEEHPGHKALVFSQFVQTLTIIRDQLDEKGVKYAYLDGATRKRAKVVEEFENDKNCSLFLISLKAGNTGLNLTSADYVYIFDPWWNPAVEAQAIDRVHRIGQTKKVFAYKLICKDTIEEKILELQKAKKGIADDLIRVDESSFKNLDKSDLLDLFS